VGNLTQLDTRPPAAHGFGGIPHLRGDDGTRCHVNYDLVFTPTSIVWSRTLRAHTAVARENARHAARVLSERRAEREEVERFLLETRR
jgi:hypothetical protein